METRQSISSPVSEESGELAIGTSALRFSESAESLVPKNTPCEFSTARVQNERRGSVTLAATASVFLLAKILAEIYLALPCRLRRVRI